MYFFPRSSGIWKYRINRVSSFHASNWNHHREFITRFELFPVGSEHIFKQPEHHPFVGALKLDKDEYQDQHNCAGTND